MNPQGISEELQPLLADVNTEKRDAAIAILNFTEAGMTLRAVAETMEVTL